MAACTPSIHVFLGRPLFLLSPGIHSIINFGILSSGILLTWPYHCSVFISIMSMMSGFPFTPIISFICSFFIFSILDFLADLLNTSISVAKILFICLVGICHTSAPYSNLPYFYTIQQFAILLHHTAICHTSTPYSNLPYFYTIQQFAILLHHTAICHTSTPYSNLPHFCTIQQFAILLHHTAICHTSAPYIKML